jgi:hypothetical protein
MPAKSERLTILSEAEQFALYGPVGAKLQFDDI